MYCVISSEIQQSSDEDMEQLSQDKLMLLMTCDPMVEYISACDHLLYQCIVDFLIPEVLSPIPGTLTQAIRNFAKSLESWLTNTIQGYPQNLVKTKVGRCTLRRITNWGGLGTRPAYCNYCIWHSITYLDGSSMRCSLCGNREDNNHIITALAYLELAYLEPVP